MRNTYLVITAALLAAASCGWGAGKLLWSYTDCNGVYASWS
jgi:hypothetical protein